MCQVAISVPDDVLYDTRLSAEDVQALARQMTALGLYRKHCVSLGYCAQIAGMHKSDFIRFLGENEVSIFSFESSEEFDEELANAERALELAHA